MDAKKGSASGDELELWAALIEMYEAEHVPIPPPHPIEAIRFRMEQEGLRPQDLVSVLGSRSRVSEVLNGRRQLTLPMIRRLHTHLGIPTDILVQEATSAP